MSPLPETASFVKGGPVELAISAVAGVGLLFAATASTRFQTTVGVIALDASLSEKHLKQNIITMHPIESGKDVADHIRHVPDRIEISGIISNTPLIILASLRAKSPIVGGAPGPFGTVSQPSDFSNPADRAKRADEAFIQAMEQGLLVQVSTSLRDYKNMAIESYTVIRDKDTSNILSFTISLVEVVIVETVQVTLPAPVAPVDAPIVDNGVKPTEPVVQDSIIRNDILQGNIFR